MQKQTESKTQLWGLVLMVFMVNDCDTGTTPPGKDTVPEEKPVIVEPRDAGPSQPPAPSCESRIQKIVFSTEDTGPTRYEKNLPYVVVGTNTVPVKYLTLPKRHRDPDISGIIKSLGEKPSVRKAIRNLKKRYKGNRAMLRRVFLSDGYFYEDRSHVANALSREITLPDLFSDQTLFRLRGSSLETLKRSDGEYIDSEGRRASLRLNDRVAVSERDLFPLLHLDLGAVRKETGAIRIEVHRHTESRAVAELLFPHGDTRPALLGIGEKGTEIECIGGDRDTLSSTIKAATAFWQRHEQVYDAARKLVEERPMFDEPKDEGEEVQEDGELRVAWKKAYRKREKTFWFREVEYDVYDRRGNPVPPEVCVDFIIDTWERASGTWYTPKGTRPRRTQGEIDFYAMEGIGRRYISSILDYARQEESPFSRYDVPRRDWAPLEKRRRFVKKLLKNAPHYQEGDLLVIHGLREEDMQEHYHTVLILRTDPVTGVPTLVADNQGRPRISTLVQAMRAAPKRSVKHRLRLDFEKMKQLTEQYRLQQSAESE